MVIKGRDNEVSDLIVNIRIGAYHFQITNKWRVSFERNPYHVGRKQGLIEVFQFFGYSNH